MSMQTVIIALLFAVVFVLIAIGYLIASFGLTAFFGAPYVGTPKSIAREMLRFAALSPGETFTDLGSGSGTLVILAAQEFGARRAVGYDINPLLIWISRLRARFAGVSDRVEFRRANFFRAPLESTDVLSLYLLPGTVDKIQTRIRAEFSPQTRVVSRGFPLRTVAPRDIFDGYRSTLYLYYAGDFQDRG